MKICKCGGEVRPIRMGDEVYYVCKDCGRIKKTEEEFDYQNRNKG